MHLWTHIHWRCNYNRVHSKSPRVTMELCMCKDGCSCSFCVNSFIDLFIHTVFTCVFSILKTVTAHKRGLAHCLILSSHKSVQGHTHSSYLDLDGPWEVTDVDIKSNVRVASEGELFTWETVSIFLDVCFGHDGHLLSRDCSSCRVKEFMFRI